MGTLVVSAFSADSERGKNHRKKKGREEEEGAEKGRKNRAAPLSKDVKIRSVFVVNIHFYLTSGRPYDKIITIGKNYND